MCTRRLRRRGLMITLVVLLGSISGCNWEVLAGSAASFTLGIITASHFQKTTTEYRCFRGGVEVDCGDLVPTESP
jgi:hypothetical protein